MEFTQKSEKPKCAFTCVIAVLSFIVWAVLVSAASNAKIVSDDAAGIAMLIGAIIAIAFCILGILGWMQACALDRLRDRGFSILALSGNFWRGLKPVFSPEIEHLYRVAVCTTTRGGPVRAAVLRNPREIWYICHLSPQGRRTQTRHIFIDRCPEHWPCTSLEHHGYFQAEWATREFKQVSLEDPEFDREVLVRSTDAGFARLLIGPKLRHLVLSLGYADEVVIGRGAICLITRAKLSQKQIDCSLNALAEVRNAIPPELSEWTPDLPEGAQRR